MRYTIKIRTGDVTYAGTDANVFIALAGLEGSMREVEITDPDSVNDWEKGDINSTSIETEELGELQTGTLREDRSGTGPGWFVDWVKGQHGEDGREWTAQVGAWSDHDGRNGRFPVLRFTRTDDGQYEALERQKAEAARKRRERDAEKKAKDDIASADKQIDLEIARLEKEAELADKRRKLAELQGKINGTTPAPSGTTSPAVQKTFELYGVVNGANVPLSRAVTLVNGRFQVNAGARVMIGDQPADGYGYAGTPGKWASVYPSTSPTAYGQDADKGVLGWDGAKAWVIPAETLTQLFGANWRSVVY